MFSKRMALSDFHFNGVILTALWRTLKETHDINRSRGMQSRRDDRAWIGIIARKTVRVVQLLDVFQR